MDNIINLFKQKVAARVYKPSNASYRSPWFCIKKKNGSLHIAHDLQPLNVVTICNTAIPPFVDQFMESMAMQACYAMLSLFVSYNYQALNVASCNLTSFQTPLGAFRCMVLPQGVMLRSHWTSTATCDVLFVEFVGPQQPNGEMAQWGNMPQRGNMAQRGNGPKGKVWVHTRK